MPKIKMLARNPDDYLRETKKDIHKVPRNYDPTLHPFEAPREYSRALNAAKLDRVFAKPFLGSLDGHLDGVECLCKHPSKLSLMVSGSYDGEIRLWNLPKRKCISHITAHESHVKGMCFHPDGEYFFSCGDDKMIKQWNLNKVSSGEQQPSNTILGKAVFHGIDHHWKENTFATCGHVVEIWDEERTEPIRTFSWGVDSVNSIRFNPVEHHILGATAADRSILLYDMRGSTPLRKVILKLRSNTLCWNPMEAYVFTVANEDYNLYSFDLRNLSRPLNIYMDHVSAVMDVDYSPTGREFVSGSYDKTVRIFQTDQSRSREVYHTKRMQRVMCVKWSLDNKYIMSGSDEMNIRVWKAKASEKLGVLKPREKDTFNYNEKLKERFGTHPEVRRILKHRHVPRSIYTAAKEIHVMKASRKRKEANRRAHSKPGSVPHVAERYKHIVGEVE